MSGIPIQCKCGRFLAKAHAVAQSDEWGDWRLHDVRGDCSRCGPDVQAGWSDDAWWWSWDNWKWPASIDGYPEDDLPVPVEGKAS